jgi:hypothetical protein
MQQFLNHLASTAQNLHVSIPMVLALACEAGKIWLPSHRDQFDATQKLFFSYGVIAAANTAPPAKP